MIFSKSTPRHTLEEGDIHYQDPELKWPEKLIEFVFPEGVWGGFPLDFYPVSFLESPCCN